MTKLKLPALQLSILLSLCMQAEAKSYRDPKIRAEFQRLNPCPNKEWQIRPGTQGGRRGACPGWQVDHIEPLCSGAKDELQNLQWLSVEQHRLKTLVDIQRCAIIRREKKEAK